MTFTRGPKRQRRRLTASLLVVAVVTAMLLSVIPYSGIARASDNPVFDPNISQTLSNAPVDDPTDDPQPPVETPTPEPTVQDPNVIPDLPTEVVIAEDPEPTYGDVIVNKISCPEGYDGTVASIYDLAANCHDQEVVTFTLTDKDGASSSLNTPGGGLNTVTFSGVPTGSLTISEMVPSGYASPRVFCKNTSYAGPETAELEQGISNGTVYSELLGGYDVLYCDWFNMHEPTGGDVIINKIGCPLGFDAYAGDIYDLAANCHEQPVATFHLSDKNGATYDATTPGNGVNSVTFSNIPTGEIGVVEDSLPGYGMPRVFCKNESYSGGSTSEDEVQVGDYGAWGINYELQEGYDFVWCDWFNVPTGTGTIEIQKWECPADFVPASDSIDEYYQNCTSWMTGVPFHAAIDGSDLPTKQSGDDGEHGLIWSDVDAGSLTIQEEIPSGYGAPVVYCGFTYTSTVNGSPVIADGKVFPDSVIDGVLQKDFAQGESLYCDWFNIPTDHDGSITIIKHTCPAGYDVNAYGANPWLDCEGVTNGVTFKLNYEGNFYSQSNTGDSIDGAVYWGGIQGGNYQVQETMPADTQYAFVYGCYSDNDESLAPTNLIGLEFDNTFLIDLKPGENLTCHWYNVPNRHGGTIVITKYWCDGAVYNSYACDIYEKGASFTIASGGWSTDVTTGWDGTVALNVDAGSYSIDEIGDTWCHAEASDVDQYGNIVVYDDQVTYVTIFNCGPRETPKTPKTPKFPNTGVGPEMALPAA